MPNTRGIGQVVLLIGNPRYGWVNATLPAGGQWYCSRSDSNLVGADGTWPLAGASFNKVEVIEGGARVYDVVWAMHIA